MYNMYKIQHGTDLVKCHDGFHGALREYMNKCILSGLIGSVFVASSPSGLVQRSGLRIGSRPLVSNDLLRLPRHTNLRDAYSDLNPRPGVPKGVYPLEVLRIEC